MRFLGIFLILSFFSTAVFASLPKVSKARIKRGATEFPIDFSEPMAGKQIQDFDVILLDEGVYSTLGDFSAKYVRVRGKGPLKTVLSFTSPALINATEFWDLTLSDAQFKVSESEGLWAVNVEFIGSILVKPASPEQPPHFSVRSIFSDLSASDIGADSRSTHFMPMSQMRVYPSAATLLALEDKFDRKDSGNLKVRSAHKGLIARGLNYLYQKEVLKPQFDENKYQALTAKAREAKVNGLLFVSMLTWAEADRLSGHSRFDEVLREITPLNQGVGQESGCTVEGQDASRIEEELYTRIPITALPGRCKIQTLQVNIPEGGNKTALIAAARAQFQTERMKAFQAVPGEEEILMGDTAPVAVKDTVNVADVEVGGLKKSFSTEKGKDIVTPITETLALQYAGKVKAAKAKIASSNLVAKVDGFITWALYGDDPSRQSEYESLHEQQFGRKMSAAGAMSSVFAY